METPVKNLDLRVGGKYRLQQRIGDGCFSDVYIAINVETNEEVAIKLEDVSTDVFLLEDEARIYRALSGGAGIPQVYAYLNEPDYNAMVLDLLGPSLEDLFNFCSRKFSLKTVLMLADQLIHRLEYIHSKNIIHRDVKPQNFLMGNGKHGNQVYVIDLGLAEECRTAPVKANLPPVQYPHLVGTLYFASVNGHLGAIQHLCDDLESLGYMLLYFLRNSLPWKSVKAANDDQTNVLVLKHKQTIETSDLCDDLPPEFKTYFDHIRSLGFGKKPRYSYLRKIFRDLFIRQGFDYDHVFDWTILKYLMDAQ